ncbi:MAG TPA: histidine--tRNA ligase [Bryobacteraceae bacterium]|nr:histidine--tRNA ligase [Bryobacteraceae bacterium]
MIRAVRGTRDILPPASAVWNRVEAAAREVFRTFNYHEIRTPIFEETALFARGVGQDTDIVGKEMYTWDDYGTSLTLRPEATASVMRAYIEHRLDQIPGVKKYYYIGPMFRRERPQKGRYRQFFQIGAEAIGSESPIVDAEVIEMVIEVLKRCGLRPASDSEDGFRLVINSVGDANCRPQYERLLIAKLQDPGAGVLLKLCGDCQRRAFTNPLRVLDCKVPADQAIIDTLPSILDHLCEKCHAHFKVVQAHLHGRGIPYEIRPRLVRGLDYYMRTTFEITHGSLGAQNSVLGGGRYDGLAEALDSRVPAPGIGFSIGEDRLVMSVSEAMTSGEAAEPMVDVFLAPMGDAAEHLAGSLAAELRAAGISVERSVDRKLKRALEVANKMGARFALIVGDDEIAAGTYLLKDMASGEQRALRREELVASIMN